MLCVCLFVCLFVWLVVWRPCRAVGGAKWAVHSSGAETPGGAYRQKCAHPASPRARRCFVTPRCGTSCKLQRALPHVWVSNNTSGLQMRSWITVAQSFISYFTRTELGQGVESTHTEAGTALQGHQQDLAMRTWHCSAGCAVRGCRGAKKNC